MPDPSAVRLCYRLLYHTTFLRGTLTKTQHTVTDRKEQVLICQTTRDCENSPRKGVTQFFVILLPFYKHANSLRAVLLFIMLDGSLIYTLAPEHAADPLETHIPTLGTKVPPLMLPRGLVH